MSLTADAQVKTDKAERYLKALCNHFSHKVTAEYSDNKGKISFDFGTCQLEASSGELHFHVTAENDEDLSRVESVIGRHLERFSGDDALTIQWNQAEPKL